MHLIRNAMTYVSYGDRKKVAAALKPIYSAPTNAIESLNHQLRKITKTKGHFPTPC